MKSRGSPPWDVADGLEGDSLDPLPLDHDERVLARYLSPGRGVGTRGCVHLLLVLPVWTTLQVHRTMESPTHTAPNLLPACSGHFPGPRQTVQWRCHFRLGGGGCVKGAGRGWNQTHTGCGVLGRVHEALGRVA